MGASGSITLKAGPTSYVNSESSSFGFITAFVKSFRILDPSVNPTTLAPVHGDPDGDVLLTGATGFLGAFILDELLRSTTATRDAAQTLYTALSYLASPMDYSALSKIYRDVWWPVHLGLVDEGAQLREEALVH